MYWLSCSLDVGCGGMPVPGWMYLWCDLNCLIFCCEQLYFSEGRFLGSAEAEIMLLRTYSFSSKHKVVLHSQERCCSAERMNGILSSDVVQFLGCRRKDGSQIYISTGQMVIQSGIYGLVVSPGLFLFSCSPMRSKSNLVLSNAKEGTVAECQLLGFISCTARC